MSFIIGLICFQIFTISSYSFIIGFAGGRGRLSNGTKIISVMIVIFNFLTVINIILMLLCN